MDTPVVRPRSTTGRLVAVLIATLALAVPLILAGPPAAHAQTPGRVAAMCGDQAVPWESLCNVEPELQEAFQWIERIGGQEDFLLRNRLSAMIRDRHAVVDWHPNEQVDVIHPGLLGLFDLTTSRVYVPQGIKSEPQRVKATILAHELAHAIWQVDNLGADVEPIEACLRNESLAFRVGILIYVRVFTLSGEGDRPRGPVDAALMRDVNAWWAASGGQGFTTAGLNALAGRHLRAHGYVEQCARLG